MYNNPEIIALRKYIYEAIQNSDSPKTYHGFFNYISFPPEQGNEIMFPFMEERILADMRTFQGFIKKAESEFHEGKSQLKK